MPIVTTYVCDVSGKQGPAEDFLKVSIAVNKVVQSASLQHNLKSVGEKFIHLDVAKKLGLLYPKISEPQVPVPTFESQISTLLRDYINDIVADEVSEQMSHRS